MRGFIQVVSGPGQVGKTTMVWLLIRQLLFESMFVFVISDYLLYSGIPVEEFMVSDPSGLFII
jgi:predicted AAA+ superfamily ATPase